jgi:hypothetical protein
MVLFYTSCFSRYVYQKFEIMEPYNKAKQHALKAQMILNDQVMPTYEKVHYSLLAFKGMVLSSIPTKTQKSVESVMLKIQQVFNRYPIKTFEDYQLISEEELNEILLNISGLCSEILKLK